MPGLLTAILRQMQVNHLEVDHVSDYIDFIVSFQACEVAILGFPGAKRNDGADNARKYGTGAFSRLGCHPPKVRGLAERKRKALLRRIRRRSAF